MGVPEQTDEGPGGQGADGREPKRSMPLQEPGSGAWGRGHSTDGPLAHLRWDSDLLSGGHRRQPPLPVFMTSPPAVVAAAAQDTR